MGKGRGLVAQFALWVAVITALHLSLNIDWASVINDYMPINKRKLNVAYISVTCHLACPVTDYISRHSKAGNLFLPKMFQGFPEIKEALIANRMQAGFLVAPLAIALKSQGVPIKIVYLGHRYGSAMVVQSDGPIHQVADLRGRTIAIPNRFSDEHLIVLRALKTVGMTARDVHLVEMAPPDVAAALSTHAIDGFSMGEPYPSQAEMGGFGRILFNARQFWPDYMSCVLVVRQDVIDQRPEVVQELIDGIARSGMWLDEGLTNRSYAADFVARFYYNQPPALLQWALTKQLDRVQYSPLTPFKKDFDLVVDLMVQAKLLEQPMQFTDYVDTRFAEKASGITSWRFKAGDAEAEAE